MAKTTLKPWQKENILVDIESTEVLTKEEEEAVARGIRIVFSLCFEGESWPALFEIKQAIKEDVHNPELAQKLTGYKYRRCC